MTSPDASKPAWSWEGEDLLLRVRVQTRASKDEINGIQNNALKVRIKAAPVDGKANRELVRFLAKIFGVGKTRVMLISGETSRTKRLRIISPKKLPGDISR
jgi:uncharacterized protein (TIGR00251 family)